jgi:outer membrane protein OmpA-like peptidoglycan-associated protein
VDGKWKNVTEFPFNSDDYSVGHPSLSSDGKVMYFVSDMPGGYGGTDIYRTFLIDGKWSTPENLGEVINTPGNEMFPFIYEDGSLYFSSNAHNSMGGLDVFITYYTGSEWATPENLNYPINSPGDDFAFSINTKTAKGFVSSSRSGNDAIYKFKKNDPTFTLFGIAKKKDTEERVEGVTVQIINEETGTVIEEVSDAEGKFDLKLEMDADYLLICTKEGCFARTDKLSTKGLKFSEDFYADFLVEEIEIGKPIVLENIYYDFDKYVIREDAANELEKLVQLLKDNPTLEIELSSHTDVRGSERYNRILSDKRAKSAVDYLINRGIDKDRLTWKGYGKSRLINHCDGTVKCSDEEHQLNRRTEFTVLKVREK